MWTRIRRIFALQGPVFEDEEKTHAAGLVHAILLATAVLMIATLVAVLAFYGVPKPGELFNWMTIASLAILSVVSAGLLWLNHRGRVQLAGAVLTALLWVGTTFAIYSYGGLFDLTITGYFLTIIVAGLLLGRWAGALVAAASLLSAAGLYFVESSDLMTFVRRAPEPFDLIILAVTFGLTAILIRYAIQTTGRAAERARFDEQALAESNRELRAIRADLEQSVTGLQRQSAYLQGSAEVGRAASSILESGELIEQVVYLIRERFGLYYVGLFLLEGEGESTPSGRDSLQSPQWAVLRAGTGEAGKSMLARGHRIHRGEGMIGWCVEQGQARIALDVGADAVRLATTELPSTRSEAALPLRSRGRVLGALTVQSEKPAAFDQDTLTVLQIMADQVAVALDNAQLFAESRQALEAARGAYGRLTREAWLEVTRARPDLGFRRDKGGLAPVGVGAGLKPAPEGTLTAPIKVRGQVIGEIDAHKETWTADEAAALELLADQLGAALEGARLFRDARRHAAHEQAVRHITEQMRRGLEVEEILQTTVTELGRTLGVPRAYVRLGSAKRTDK